MIEFKEGMVVSLNSYAFELHSFSDWVEHKEQTAVVISIEEEGIFPIKIRWGDNSLSWCENKHLELVNIKAWRELYDDI